MNEQVSRKRERGGGGRKGKERETAERTEEMERN